MENTNKNRKGKIVNVVIGEDIRKRIPRCMDNIYKVEALPVNDVEDLEKDETLRMYTLRTVLVEGTSVVDNGRAVNVNGEFEISLEDSNDDSENETLKKVYRDKDEAIAVWRRLTKAQCDRVDELFEKVSQMKVALHTSYDEEQY